MKSHKLAKILLKNPDVELILQKDSEGNGYSLLQDVDFNVVYVPEDNAVYDKDWSADDCCLEEDEWEELKETNSAYAVLYPKY